MSKVKMGGPLKVHDGSGTKSKPLMTGHGAPPVQPASNGGGVGNIRSNNWGAKSLKKLRNGPSSVGAPGYDRFVQPTDASTANVPPPGSGNPSN